MKRQITYSKPKSHNTLCKICNESIAKGEECVLFETYAAGNVLKLFIHTTCFKITE